MPIDRIGDPWSGNTYKGFSGGPAVPPDPPRTPARALPPRRGPSTRVLMLGGVAGALALGVLFGLWARPELIGSRPASGAAPPAAATASPAPPGAAQVPIAVNPPPAPEAPPRAPTPLQTLPPEMAAAARAHTPRPAATPESASAWDAPAAPQAPETAAAAAATTPPAAVAPTPAPRLRASFDCATARPGAEELVCGDAGLAAADRQMAQAYRRALSSGVDPDDLRQEQRDWMAIREDAALRSREALAQVYDQRIQELDRIADSAPGEGD